MQNRPRDRFPAKADEPSCEALNAQIDALASEPVAALSALSAYAKKKAARDHIDEALTCRAPVYALLRSQEPKARKNAARLLGALGDERDANELAALLSREDTLFVLPSVLLALGAVGGTAARTALEAYAPPVSRGENDEKHVSEIAEALNKARAALHKDEPLPSRNNFTEPQQLLAVSPRGFADVLVSELTKLGFEPHQTENGALVCDKRIKKLYTARCLSEALLPVAEGLPVDAGAVAEAADSALTCPYRIELRGYEGDRAAFIRRVSHALGGGDNPSRYVDELRIECENGGLCVYIKPCNVHDARFAYRKRALPASMQPASAACLAAHALSLLTLPQDAPVTALDPFCGSGTLLFELERIASCKALIGTDISRFAIEAARENAAAAHSRAVLLQKDALRFEPREPFDLILTNLPFGNRVGTHENNEALYAAFVRRLPALLKPGGVAALYTADSALLKRCLSGAKGLRIVETRRTEAGGLAPTAFFVTRKV